jgi:hypothetical protein
VPPDWLQDLCAYWADGYDWRGCPALLNAAPQFTTDIDGVRIHFLHVRSPHAKGAVPRRTRPLIDPVATGGDPSDAFHVVCPSPPGYGFSGKPTEAAGDRSASRGRGRR